MNIKNHTLLIIAFSFFASSFTLYSADFSERRGIKRPFDKDSSECAKCGKTALHWAIINAKLNWGIIDEQNRDEDTKKAKTETIKYLKTLFKQGLSPIKKDKKGHTAISLAKNLKIDEDIITMLEQALPTEVAAQDSPDDKTTNIES